MRRLLAAGLLIPLLAEAGCSRSSAPEAPVRPPVLVKVAPAERRDVPFIVRAPGLVVASETVEVHARVDSQVMAVHFREGDMVHAGQLLFTLDDRTMMADLRRQEATLATAQAELENARRQYDRARKLAAGGFESTAELDKARADFESNEARAGATRAEIERLHVLLGYTKITAAIDGRVGSITATVGNTVKANDAGTPLVVINQVSPIRVQIGLPQQALAPLRELMAKSEVPVRVIRDGIELADKGRIEFVDNSINRTTATFECRAEFANKDEALWPGMIVEIVIQLGEDTGVIAVPEIAVQHTAGGDFVFTVVDSKAVRRPVTVRRYGDGVAVVTDGLQGGEQVVTDGMLSLSEGSPVDVPDQNAAKATPDGAGSKPAPDGARPAPGEPAKK
ncbi:MAG TPA: efflux RND transporter periplasmic adaptor subunit [Candidatus Limnocylindrales bacterium]|nr:efflux RND transporter periplasmic adaptor subunit [Candidatus Limnocylindrales bacterium]